MSAIARWPHLAQRLFNAPLALRPEKAEMVAAALGERLGLASFNGRALRQLSFDGDGDSDDTIYVGEESPHRYYELVQGVALIPIEGTLVQKSGCCYPWSGMTGYDGIRANIAQALEDIEVKAIALVIDSPGGEVAGCADLADWIYAQRGQKPIWAICDEGAYSAAYWIASSCDRVTVPRTGGTGSIGVIAMHVDFSKALDQAGINVTLLTYGARKADGAQVKPLSDEAQARFLADIAKVGDLFSATVARNRGLSAATVRGFEAGCFQGADGVEAGLADAVLSSAEAFTELLQKIAA